MIVDDTVQKERSIMDAGGLSPNMASFLMKDAQNIISNAPPSVTTTRDWGEPAYQGGFTGDTRKIANPHSTRYYTVGKK